jgi:hypothetical protein
MFFLFIAFEILSIQDFIELKVVAVIHVASLSHGERVTTESEKNQFWGSEKESL